MVSIGPVTSATARELGLEVHVEAERHDIDGLVDALLEDAAVIVTLLTDYGRDDDFVGVCHGVIRAHRARRARSSTSRTASRATTCAAARSCCATRCPTCRWACTWRWWTPRWAPSAAALALRCDDGRMLVGPDNGLLSLAWEAAGGVDLAVDVTRSPHRLEPVSATFHGRDVFAPVAAHLAAGAPSSRTPAAPLDPERARARWSCPRPRTEGDALVAHVLTSTASATPA